MRHAIPLMLQADTVAFIDQLVKKRSAEQGREISRTEVVESIISRYWITVQKNAANKRFDQKVAARSNGVTGGLRKA